MVHGGGFTKGTRTWNTGMSQWLADNGYVVLNVDYRLAPTWVYPAMEYDVVAAMRWLKAQQYISSVSVFGTSAGAIIAEEIPTHGGKPASAVAWSGMGQFDPNDSGVQDHLGCSQTTCPTKFANAEPVSGVERSDPPLFIAHSVRDPGIAAWTDEALASAYLAPMTFYEPTGSVHGTNFFQDPTALAKTLAFLAANAS
jgi:acetyl esterase/lipase